DTITEAILLFADSTADQLRGLASVSAPLPGDAADHVRGLLESLKGHNEGDYDIGVLEPLLNGAPTGFFLARLERAHGGPILFEVDPNANEAVQLHRPVSRSQWGGSWRVVTQSPLQRPLSGTGSSWVWRERLDVPHYTMDVHLTTTSSANLDFAARATLSLTAREPVGPWLWFGLHEKLLVDSARWTDGQAVFSYKAKDGNVLWVHAPRRLAAGDSATVTLFYHGEHGGMIDRFGDWFYIDPGAEWWPLNGQGKAWALFDITFHSPNWYP